MKVLSSNIYFLASNYSLTMDVKIFGMGRDIMGLYEGFWACLPNFAAKQS